MSYFFSDHFRTALAANQAVMDGQKIRLVFFRYAPAMGTTNAAWTAARTVAELTALPGWTQVSGITGYPLNLQLDVSSRTIGASRYLMFSRYPFTGLGQTAEIRAIGVEFVGTLNGQTNPLIMVTNTPLGGIANVTGSDALTANPDAAFPDATNRWLFGWGVTTPTPIEGPLVLSVGSPPFEVSGSQHAWLYPQRVNMIANPSFELPGTGFWSGNSTVARVSGGAPGGGAWAGSCVAVGEGAYLTPSVGTASTPTFPEAQITADTVWVAKLRKNSAGSLGHIATKSGLSNNYAWEWSIEPTGDLRLLLGSATGTVLSANIVASAAQVTALPAGVDFYLATYLNFATGVGALYSTDGVTWTAFGTPVGFTAGNKGNFLSPTTIKIGRRTATPEQFFDGRIYWVEQRTGLSPTAGAVVWRYDNNERTGTGTTFTDPRGKIWTLTSASGVTAATAPPSVCIMESNTFPTQLGDSDHEQWTVQLMAKGTGTLKVAIVYWDADYRVTIANWGGDEEWILSPDTWTHIATHRHCPEAHIAMVRLELEGGPLHIDKVLAERGYLKDWLYFDGDERYGARDDFSWYGGTNRQGASYSLWYNHRKAVTGRLFARTVDPNDPSQNVTDEDMEEQGLVYRWVPAGITVVPHLDILYPFDVQNPLPAKPAGVLSRSEIPSPWT